ncbi:MAG: KUP/HAK/KT family potassium transporter, partial [Hydrogenophaga sp.]|nr:KUP/HAK/KT family potassium transporter [Hydrogenophaga sp.]
MHVDRRSAPTPAALAALTLTALGVVFGDIGTSPMYALREVFHSAHLPVNEANVLGVLSLLFWTMTLVVSLKYVLLILRADNHGEGGLIAMMALATEAVRDRPVLRRRLMVLGLFGTAVFFGDAVITPAITVLSAMEGIDVYAPEYHGLVVPLALVILTVLFSFQRFGTATVGRLFGPVMLVWFAVLALLGLPWVVATPEVLQALNPAHAVGFGLEHRWLAFVALGAAVLVVTGGEALYADLGHFGRRPIRWGWYGIVMPALVINYFAQGALLLKDPAAIKNPFFLLAPAWAEIPVFALATLAATVASQALISASFSVGKQAMQLGILPRMRVWHTSVKETGQIYVPFINWALYVFVVVAVVSFESSSALTSAYGVAVTMDMTITTVLTFFVIRHGWKYPLWLCVAATGVFFVIDVVFLASNLLKVPAGGWFPLAVGAGCFLLMLTWQQGRRLLSTALRDQAIDLPAFLQSVFVSPPTRVEGTAVFLSAEEGITPNALLHNLKHNKVLHQQNLFVTVCHHERPWIPFDQRIEVKALGHHCWQVTLHFGFKNEPDVPEALRLLSTRGIVL